ncbi:peptidoglycan-binding protein [Candidatus Parcubacteria bacterium]|nr:peptidoglycan-binding protein [Candidatus Parcubacteria bacterium]
MQNLIAKTAGVVVAIALFVGVAVPASALTASELVELLISLDIISSEKADAARAALGTTGSTSGSTAAGYNFTRDLTIGSTGADVVALQDVLIDLGYLNIPAGVSKGYFGSLTQSALASMQAAEGISPASGYFGPITRSAFAGLVSTPTTPTTPTTPSTGLQGGAGSIDVTERSSGVEDEVLEGANEVKVLGFEIEATGSDIAVTSVRVEFEHDGSGSDRLDRYVDEVQIMMGNTVVGTVDVDDFSENNDVYSRNIAVSNAIIDEDEEERFYVAVSAIRNIDSNDLDENWEVAIGQIRYEDATGAILTDATGTGVNGTITETFTFEDLSTSGDVELTVREDDSSINNARTIEISETSDTNGVEILSFELEAEGSDLELDSLEIDITSVGAGVTEIANDFELFMEGKEVGRVTIDGGSFASSSVPTRTLTFIDLDDDDVVIEEGDRVSFVLKADINDIDGGFTNGDSFSVVFIDSADIDADDENGDTVTDLKGSAQADDISFAATGIMLSEGDNDSSARIFNLDTTSTDDQGKFEINFTVKAFDETAYIALTATTTNTAVSAAGAYGYIEDVNNNDVVVSTGTTTATLERVSGGTIDGNYVRLNPGQEVDLKLTLYHDAASTGNFRGQLGQVNFNDTKAAGDDSQDAVPTSDYQSPSEQILN